VNDVATSYNGASLATADMVGQGKADDLEANFRQLFGGWHLSSTLRCRGLTRKSWRIKIFRTPTLRLAGCPIWAGRSNQKTRGVRTSWWRCNETSGAIRIWECKPAPISIAIFHYRSATVFPGAGAAKDLSEPALGCTTVLLARQSATVARYSEGSFVRNPNFRSPLPGFSRST
jgi:hypothetical protein